MKLDLENLINQARCGGTASNRAAAQLMSVMTDQPRHLAALLRGSYSWPQPRMILGITGAPGSGKSTLTDHLVAEYRYRFPDRRIGIVAVDPSSPFTGGALLGDRVRMMRHATDPKVFIRSLASRGHLGGLALGAKGVCRVMGLIGCDVVLVETVGVGQSEVEIATNCDLTMVVLAPGQGDSIQMLKAGLIEAGDLFVVNKADREGANQLYQTLLSALAMESRAQHDLRGDSASQCGRHHLPGLNGKQIPHSVDASVAGDVSPNLFLVSAANHQNMTTLVDELEIRADRLSEEWRDLRREQVIGELRHALFEEIRRRAFEALGDGTSGNERIEKVLRGEDSIEALAVSVLQQATTIRQKNVQHPNACRKEMIHDDA